MTRVINWIKANKLTFILLLIVGYFIVSKFFITDLMSINSTLTYPETGGAVNVNEMSLKSLGGTAGMNRMAPPEPYYEAPPAPDVENRMVISESYLSLLVKDVRESQNQIIQTAKSMGGYMVNSYLNNPQDAPTSTLTVRVASDKFQQALEIYRGMAVKVVSENLSGQDVTDQYVNNEARLATLEQTKAKFEEIFAKAESIDDILNVQQQILNIQSQIDQVVGQQNYLEKNAQMARLTIYLSTDEFALPYAPSESWRPEVIFKQAVRSVIIQIRKLCTLLIWLTVYSIIWLPVLFLILYFRRKKLFKKV